jgi:hypothetical protein
MTDSIHEPAHYTRFPVEVIDIAGHLNFPRGNVVKYVARAGHKAGADELDDLRKARVYPDWEINRLEGERT